MKNKIKLYTLNDENTYDYCAISYPFRVFFSLNKDDLSPKNNTFKEDEKIPDYILYVLKSFTNAFNIFINDCKLKNPLKEGIYFDKGAHFIDVMISNIPVQKGLVASKLIDNEALFNDSDNMGGKAIRILLDRNLIKGSATPIHELFHVFQYNYCDFNNMWFMEGLARWSQNLTHTRKDKNEKLPSNLDELEILLYKAHESEYFWRRLLFLCGNSKEFISIFLEKLEAYNRYVKDKKALQNNRYIFLSLVYTIDKLEHNHSQELSDFLHIIKKVIHQDVKDGYDWATDTLVVDKLDCSDKTKEDIESYNHIKHITGDLIIESTDMVYLNCFNHLKTIGGTLKIVKNDNLVEINGFNSLERVHSLLIEKNKELEEVYGFFKLFTKTGELNGSLKIINNQKLSSLLFLHGLKKVGSSLYLHHNALESLKGLEDLEEVYASLSLSSNKLKNLKPLKNLQKVNGMLGLAYNKLTSLDGIDNLTKINTVKWNGEYRSIAIQGNDNLEDIHALNSVKSIKKHFILYIDSINNYKLLPEDNAEFYNQDIIVKTRKKILSTRSIFAYYKKPEKVKVLFLDKWKKTISSIDYIYPYFHDFKDINKVIDYCNLVDINVIYAQVVSIQNFVHKYKKTLKENDIKFIINDKIMLDTFVNKKKFYNFMLTEKMGDYIPNVYKKMEDVKFPAIVKAETGANGKNMEIVYTKEELELSNVDGIVSEYIANKIEYASHIFVKNTNILTAVTYKKTSLNEFYIMKQNTGAEVKFEIIETPFINIFTKVLSKVSKNSGYALACIDYKIVDGKPKIFEINPRLGYTLFKRQYDLKSFIDIYLKELNLKKEKVLFGDRWQNKMAECDWLNAHHISFRNITNVIEYCKKFDIKILFANNYTTQMAILKHKKLFQENGLHFIVNNQNALQQFVDKQIFYEKMIENNMSKYLPKYYDIDDDIDYPCMVKTKTGGAGRGVFLAYEKSDIGVVDDTIIISEYLSSNIEYATSIFYKDGKILKAITYSKTSSQDIYVLQQMSKDSVSVKREKSQFLDIFQEIIEHISGKDDYCACSINFKIQDGIPKIFEVNPRIGYTLAGFSEDFKEMMDIYINELSVIKKSQ